MKGTRMKMSNNRSNVHAIVEIIANSNGRHVMPTISADEYKMSQSQKDNGGVLRSFVRSTSNCTRILPRKLWTRSARGDVVTGWCTNERTNLQHSGVHVCPTIVSVISKGPGNTQDGVCVAHVYGGTGGVRVNNHDEDIRTVHARQGQLRSRDTECTKRPTTK